MSTYLHPIYGYLFKQANSELRRLVDELYVNARLARLPPKKIGAQIESSGNSDPDLIFGFKVQEFSLDPIDTATPIETITEVDPRGKPELQELTTKTEHAFELWLQTQAPPWAKDRGLWQGPTLWLCPHS